MDLDAILSGMNSMTKDRTIKAPSTQKKTPVIQGDRITGQSLSDFLRNYDPKDPSSTQPPKRQRDSEKHPEEKEDLPAPMAPQKKKKIEPEALPKVEQKTEKTIVVQNPKHSRKIVRKLKREEILALDCEGINLGRNGRLCLIQISNEKGKVYLFDVVIGNLSQMFEEGGLRELLEDPKILKVIHDSRGDSDALFHQAGVKLSNLFDSQIAYAIYVRQTGKQTPIPVGLNTLLKKYTEKYNTEKEQARLEMSNDQEYWLKRPLTENMITYAAQDVLYLPTLYRKMKALLSFENLKHTLAKSTEYSGIFRDSEDIEEAKKRTYVDGLPKYGIPSWDQNLDFFMRNQRRAHSSLSSTLQAIEQTVILNDEKEGEKREKKDELEKIKPPN